MALAGLDPDSDQRRAPVRDTRDEFDRITAANFGPEGERDLEDGANAPLDSSELENRESGGSNSGSSTNRGSNGNSDSPSRSSTPSELSGTERQAGSEGSGLYNSSDKKSETRRAKFTGKARSLAKNKLLIVGGVAGLGGIGGLILIAVVILGALSIPNLANNITGYQFAKVARQYARNSQRITSQSLAMRLTSDAAYKNLQEKKAALQGKASKQIGKLDKYRPEKVAINLKSDAKVSFISGKSGILGREAISGIKIGEEVFTKPTVTGPARFIPVLNKSLELKNNVEFARSFGPALDAALRSTQSGTIARSIAASSIRRTLGIPLTAFNLKNVNQGDEKENRRIALKERDARANGNLIPDNATTEDIKNAVKNVDEAHALALTDNAAIDEALAKKGIFRGVREAISNAFEQSIISKITKGLLSVANPVLAVSGPFCIIYDGSLNRSGGTIDNDNKQKMQQFSYLTSAGDQIKSGGSDTKLATAAGTYSDSFGDTTQSTVIQRGYTGIDDTSAAPPSEASAGGQYSLLDALGFPKETSQIADGVCSLVNNGYFIAATTAASLFATFFSGGTLSASTKTAGDVAKKLAEKEATSFAERLFLKGAIQSGRAKELILGQTKSTAAIVGLTFLAQYIVVNRANESSNGTAMENDAVSIADSGGNLMGNEISRQGTYGRPLMPTEVVSGGKADVKFVLEQNSSKSAYERYLSPNNTNSLVAKMAFSVNGTLKGPISSTVTNLVMRLFSPMNLVANMTNTFSGHAAAAATADATKMNYNAVQFAWSDDEEKKIDSDLSYTAIANADILDQRATDVTKIQETYGKCFTDSMGTLLSNGDIRRDDVGNVLADDSVCSPKMLGYDNPTYGDLVFRWRLDNRYNSGEDDLLSIQDPSAETANTTAPPTPGADNGGVLAGGNSAATGTYVLPVDQKWFDSNPIWFSKPHHDTPAADIPVPLGTPIYSMNAGVILRAPNEGGYGEGVMIQGDDGFQYIYGHGTDGGSIPGAKKGDRVTPGQLIMHAGNTGASQGAHLHLNIQTDFSPQNYYCPQKLLTALGTHSALPAVGSLPKSGCTY